VKGGKGFGDQLKYPFLVFVLTWPSALLAQIVQGPLPTGAECEEARNSLESGSRESAPPGVLFNCGESGAVALARALRRERSGTDTQFFLYLFSGIAKVQHPAILDAAVDIARDKTASETARAMSLLVIESQHASGTILPPRYEWEARLNGPFPADCVYGWTSGDYASAYRMPSDYQARIRAVLDTVAQDSTETEHMRNLAVCLRTMVGGT